MWRLWLSIGLMLGIWGIADSAYAQQTDRNLQLKLSVGTQAVIVNLEQHSVTEQLLSLLPAVLEFRDFAGTEKIANLPQSIELTEAPRGMIARAGKVFIYAPWGNLGIFYQDSGTTLDWNLIPVGTVESGLEYLTPIQGRFTARLEIMQ